MIPALAFKGAALSPGGRPVLAELDVCIPAGAFVGVLGPNGAGKTSLLRAAAGLLRPAAGRVEIFGQDCASARGLAGYLPQSAGAVGDLRLSGWDFVAACAGGGAWGLPIRTRAQLEDVARVLSLVDATDYAGRAVGTLSGGERQRLMLAQALLGKPRLLLLDEPLAGLDPQHQAAAVALVARLQRHLGVTVLFSAHDLNPLLPVLDLVLYLGSGHACLGTVDQVVTGAALSLLYGAPMQVVRADGHVFVVAGASPAGEPDIARL